MQRCRGYTSFGGWQLQRDLIRYNSLNRLATLLVLMLAFSGLVFLLLTPGRMVLKGVRMIAISLHSQLAADYSADLHAAALEPVGVSLIEEALGDRDNPVDVPGLIDALTTPVPLVTPMPTLPGGFFPTPGLFPTLPIPGATSTAAPKTPTLTPTLFTPTLTNTAIFTPTSTHTAIFTPTFTPTNEIVITPVVPTVTHTPTRTPTRTPTTPTPPTHTPTPTRTPTRTPPTPPTSTFTPVPTSTFTPIPYPPPITDTPYPTDTPVTPPPGETPPTPLPPTVYPP